ncbi:MAG: energy transducer TonB [Acidobacteria bacterium]|nr:energy transducer TonB [Acidobacteriota bacterium]
MNNAAGPRDAFAPAYAFAHGARAEYRPTILEEEGLLARLAERIREAARESELTFPEFKRDPLGFTGRLVRGYAAAARQTLAQENVGLGALAGFAIVLGIVGLVVALGWMGKAGAGSLARNVRDELQVVGWVEDVPEVKPTPEATGAGMAKTGSGGGMKEKLSKPGGGGGGGRGEPLQASNGKLPPGSLLPQALAPDPKPPVIKNPSLPTQTTLQADPVLFPPDSRNLPYGDPKSKATELSSGSGTGNGIGDGKGGGVGSGNGAGYGPGEGFNTGGGPPEIGGGGPGKGGGSPYDYGRTHRVSEVTRKAQIISRPEPLYTEEARKNQITGTVVLRMVLNANGSVSNIAPVSRLPDGLTEKAIAAARRIQFTPAEKDGRKVSQYATIQYNFNIY